MPIVWIPPQLRGLTQGHETVRVAGSTVGAVIDQLETLHPGIKARLCDDNGLRPGLAVAIGPNLARLGLLEPVPADSEVHFLPAISGGS